MSKKILIVLTSIDKYPDGSPTGWYAPEAIHPYYRFIEAGHSVEFASITGSAFCDPSSLPGDAECVKFKSDASLWALTESQRKLSDVAPEEFDAVLFAGGFGVMWDFPGSEACQELIKNMYEAGKVVSAVCHGPIVFANVKLSNGTWLVEGKNMTAFTNGEENAMSKYEVVSEPTGPGSCQDLLGARGASFSDGGVFKANVVIDGNLLTGQNPPSAAPLADAINEALK